MVEPPYDDDRPEAEDADPRWDDEGGGLEDCGPDDFDFDPEDFDLVDRQIEFNEATERARQKAVAAGASASELEDGSWMYRIGWADLPVTCPFEQLAFGGWTPVPVEDLPDDSDPLAADEVHAALWNLLQRLADEQVFFYQTNHLSDRDLYELIVEELLWCYGPQPPAEAGFSQTFDCAEDSDNETFLRFYADDEERAEWLAAWGDPLPPKEAPRFDRDDRLPRSLDETPDPPGFFGGDGPFGGDGSPLADIDWDDDELPF